MCSGDPDPRREALGFTEAVLLRFEFLQSYGFEPVEQEMTRVRFESPNVFVNVYHGRSSFELGVEIGRHTEPRDIATLPDILSWAGADDSQGLKRQTSFQVSSYEGVQRFVAEIAQLTEKYAPPFLAGELAAYESLRQARARWTEEYVTEQRLTEVRTEVEAAWRRKDYLLVAQLLSSVRDRLTRAEAAKLSFAEKQVTSSVGSTARSKKRDGR